MLKILADQYIYRLRDFLPSSIDLTFYDPDQALIIPQNTDILLVRTVTKLNKSLSINPNSKLQTIGTASSGSDHIDIDYFTNQGINVLDAKGCNAKAVSEYVITSLLLWAMNRKVQLKDFKVGIIGVGAAGSEVVNQLKQFEIPYVCYDPPRSAEDPSFQSASLEELLDCDILTFHVPLNTAGDYPTHHWLNADKLKGRTYQLIINAARGGIIHERDLLMAMSEKKVLDVIIDVWENEPNFCPKLAELAFIATPHIAGYSEQAKLKATQLLIEKLAAFYHFKVPDYTDLYQPKKLNLAHLHYRLSDLLLRMNPIMEYDATLRNLRERPNKSTLFTKLRVDRPYRFEYSYIQLKNELLVEFPFLNALGIHNA